MRSLGWRPLLLAQMRASQRRDSCKVHHVWSFLGQGSDSGLKEVTGQEHNFLPMLTCTIEAHELGDFAKECAAALGACPWFVVPRLHVWEALLTW